MKFLVLAVAIALASTQTNGNVFTDICNEYKAQLQQHGQAFGTTFQQLGTTALATGSERLTQALGGGAQLLTAAATKLSQCLLSSSTGRRFVSDDVEQKAKVVLNSFATDLKDKLNGEYTSAVRELQALAFESLFMSHDQLKQKVQQIVTSHSNQMTALLESLPADLVKFVEKAILNRRRGLLDGLLGCITQTTSQLAAQFLPHVQNVQQLLSNLGQTLTGTVSRIAGELLSTLIDVQQIVHGAVSGAMQTATGLLQPEQLTPGLSGARK